MNQNDDQKAVLIVFAAGKGSRMLPLTLSAPKPLISVNQKTLLEWSLLPFVLAVKKIVIVVNYLGDQIEEKIGNEYQNIPVEYAYQTSPTGGTLDALKTGILKVKDLKTSGYFVTNADDIQSKKRYQNLINSVKQNPKIAYISAATILDKNKLKSLGVLTCDENKNLLNIVEKPQEFVSNLANVGIYYFPQTAKDFLFSSNLESNLESNLKIPEGSEQFITRDFIQPYAQKEVVKVVSDESAWLMLSTPEDIKSASHLPTNSELFDRDMKTD